MLVLKFRKLRKKTGDHGGTVVTCMPLTSEIISLNSALTSCGKADSWFPFPLVVSLQYRTLTNCVYGLPLAFKL